VQKRDIRVFVTSLVVFTLFFGSVGAAIVLAFHGWSITGGPQPASTTASPTPDTALATPTLNTATPTETEPSPVPTLTPVVGVTQVIIKGYAFVPPVIQVAVGTTVTWTNQDAAAHTVTFGQNIADSGMLRTGQSFSHQFTAAGTFEYVCIYHPGMVATVIVTG
jgi:plastocyanin